MLRNLTRCVRVRHLSASHSAWAAQIFRMPAMSPTMTEGGIVAWKVKPGDLFAAGDVLLEVETDKATIDVEAQDDGVMWKVLENDGATGLPVGKPIAFLAEPGDDLASLEAPKIDTEAPKAVKEEPKPKEAKEEPKPKTETQSTPTPTPASKQTEPSVSTGSDSVFITANPNLKLFPSVELLLQKHGISDAEAYEKIPASGPLGRILYGDVLVYLGEIDKLAVEKVTKYIQSKEHLDLSNIQLAPKKETQPKETPKKNGQYTNLRVDIIASLAGKSRDNMEDLVDKLFKDATIEPYNRAYSHGTSVEKDNSDVDYFDDLCKPLASTKRFTVTDISTSYASDEVPELERAVGRPVQDDFDELLGLEPTRMYATSAQMEKIEKEWSHPSQVVLSMSIKYDNNVSDSKEFVDVFLNKMGAIMLDEKIVPLEMRSIEV